MLTLDLYIRPVPPSAGTDYSFSTLIVAGLVVVVVGIAVGAILATRRAASRETGASEGGPETGPIPVLPDDDLRVELDALLAAEGRAALDRDLARPVDVRTAAEVH